MNDDSPSLPLDIQSVTFSFDYLLIPEICLTGLLQRFCKYFLSFEITNNICPFWSEFSFLITKTS